MASVMPVNVPLQLYRGDTRIWEDTFVADGVPMDLTGYTFLSQIRVTADATEPVAVITVEVIDPGKTRRTLPATEAANLPVGKAVWDFQFTSPSGFVRTVMGGQVVVTADVSRAVTP